MNMKQNQGESRMFPLRVRLLLKPKNPGITTEL